MLTMGAQEPFELVEYVRVAEIADHFLGRASRSPFRTIVPVQNAPVPIDEIDAVVQVFQDLTRAMQSKEPVVCRKKTGTNNRMTTR